jgi:hypothetical protein
MSAGDSRPRVDATLVEHLLGTVAQQSAAFDARLAALGRRPAAQRARDARLLREDIRQARASVAVVQSYLREQAAALRHTGRIERKPS